MRGGLTSRTFLASAALTIVVGVSFALLLVAVVDLRDSVHRSQRAQEVLVVANNLERLLVDIETGERGLLLTHNPRFLQPLEAARRAFPDQAARLRALVADEPGQEARVNRVVGDIDSYIEDFSVPLVESESGGASPPHLEATLSEGKQRVDAIRNEFDGFIAAQTALVSGSENRADSQAQRAVVATVGGLAGSLILVFLFGGYLRQAVVRPLLRAAGMARLVSAGDLDARMSETGVGEIGQLERTFNGMAASLQESRDHLERLAGEQAALRRVATFVARGAAPGVVFAAVAEEIGRLLPADLAVVGRYEDGGVTAVGAWSASGVPDTVGRKASLGGTNLTTMVFETGQPARLDSYADASGAVADEAQRRKVNSGVGVPITVAGRLWGLMIASSVHDDVFPEGTEERLAQFTDLVATGIANTEAREEVNTLLGEQASLRRVATLVAEGRPPADVFGAVAKEMALVFDADTSVIHRLETDAASTLVAAAGGEADALPIGSRSLPMPATVTGTALSTGRSARVDDHDAISGLGVDLAGGTEIRSAVASPIFVDGRLWGVVAIGSARQHFPSDTEHRMVEFTELLATAVGNAQGRDELLASRARIVAASDEARRKIERDLHDSAQQRLVSLGLELRDIGTTLPSDLSEPRGQIARVGDALEEVLDNLREISRGIHPAILSQGGLVPALKALARRSPIAVDLRADVDGRLPEHVEVAAYYIVSEALTNVAKHAHASALEVRATLRDPRWLELSVHDDGAGGADPRRGSGLVGLRDRATTLGGTLEITSPPQHGTTIVVRLPVDDD